MVSDNQSAKVAVETSRAFVWPLGFVILACVFVFCAKAEPSHRQPAPGTVVWTNWVGVYYADSSPAVANDGTIYVGTWNRGLFAFRPEGRLKWTFRARSEIKSTPAIGTDGTIYFGSRDRHLYAVRPDGKLKWQFRTGGWVDASPAIGRAGTVYFGSWDEKFYAVSQAGQKQWEFATAGPVVSSAAVGADGTIYFGSHDSCLYALTPEGQRLWAFRTGGPVISSPAVGLDGTIFFTSVDGRLYALNPDGTVKWQLWTGGVSEASPVIAADGTIYCVATQHLWCVSPDGKKKWDRRISVHQWTDSTPVATDDGGVCAFSGDGTLVKYSSDGTWCWQTWLRGGTATSPVLMPDGTIYAGICAGSFQAVFGTNGPASSSWPMFRRNLRRTGNVADPP